MSDLYQFSIGSFFGGLIILVAGTLIVVFHRQIADNFAGGLSSYDKTKLWGLVTCGVGLMIMLSLHTIPLNWLFRSLFGGLN